MTQEQAKMSSQEKVKAIETFHKQMQVEVSAEQIITKEGFIKNIVFYNDIERYVIDAPKQDGESIENKEREIKIEKDFEDTGIPYVREKGTAPSFRVRTSPVRGSEGK